MNDFIAIIDEHPNIFNSFSFDDFDPPTRDIYTILACLWLNFDKPLFRKTSMTMAPHSRIIMSSEYVMIYPSW